MGEEEEVKEGGLWSPLFRDMAEKLSQDGAPEEGRGTLECGVCTLRK